MERTHRGTGKILHAKIGLLRILIEHRIKSASLVGRFMWPTTAMECVCVCVCSGVTGVIQLSAGLNHQMVSHRSLCSVAQG